MDNELSVHRALWNEPEGESSSWVELHGRARCGDEPAAALFRLARDGLAISTVITG
jgi:hypothetical protein